MKEIDYKTSNSIRGSTTPHAVDTFDVHGRPNGVILKLKYRPVQPGFRVIYRMKKKGEMSLGKEYYTVDLERGRITINWDFEQDCTFVVEYNYGP